MADEIKMPVMIEEPTIPEKPMSAEELTAPRLRRLMIEEPTLAEKPMSAEEQSPPRLRRLMASEFLDDNADEKVEPEIDEYSEIVDYADVDLQPEIDEDSETIDYADVDLQTEIDKYERWKAKCESMERVRKARKIVRAKGFARRSWRCLRQRL